MKTYFLSALFAMLLFSSCSKINLGSAGKDPRAAEGVTYLIKKGGHYADQSNYAAIDITTLSFMVRFDSSAVYETISPENQEDINKLYGFSDNGSSHHDHSARFGWRWSEGRLRLFAYVYNNGNRDFRELGIVEPGKEYNCSIAISNNQYIFTLGNKTLSMPREAKTVTNSGYRLYPYFGGDETAPHDIRIWIKEM